MENSDPGMVSELELECNSEHHDEAGTGGGTKAG